MTPFGTKQDNRNWRIEMKIQITTKEGGMWKEADINTETVIEFIKLAQYTSYWYLPVYAIRFPSGIIYDFVLAQKRDPKLRKLAWRYT